MDDGDVDGMLDVAEAAAAGYSSADAAADVDGDGKLTAELAGFKAGGGAAAARARFSVPDAPPAEQRQ